MIDILSFDTLITPNILIFLYYIGAVLVPVLLWSGRLYLRQKFAFLHTLEHEHNILFWIFLVMFFCCVELCWRMMFEMVIAYFDIHNYLYEMSTHIKKGV